MLVRSETVNSIVKSAVSRIDADLYERMLVYSVLRKVFPQIESVGEYKDRQEIWSGAIEAVGGWEAQITYVEFGVFEGRSIRYFSAGNLNASSLFIGLDSFQGLPEAWGPMAAGHFDVGGAIPRIDDGRVSFIKGWFQDSWDELRARIAARDNLLVHYDADLYSSTLFALSRIGALRKSYVAVFDEFTGHEARALYNYQQAFGASVDFLGKVPRAGYANQLLCRITPHET
jgi:O-methyltransferase